MNQYFSLEGLEKLKKELEEREGQIRTDIARKILDAKELGDLSENAEYHEARDAQSINEGRIEELKEIIRSASIISPNKKHEVVAVGSTVAVKFKNNERSFTIVGPAESNPAEGFISHESPLGAAFLGKKKGDEVEVLIPTGKVKYTIVGIK